MEKQSIYSANFWKLGKDGELPIYPFCTEYSFRHQAHKMPMNRFPFMLVCGIREGAVRFIFQKEKLLLEENDVLLIPPLTLFSFESYSTRGRYGKLAMELKGILLEDTLKALQLHKVILIKKDLWKDFLETFEKIHKLTAGSRREDIPEMAGIINRFLHICSLHNIPEKESRIDPVFAAASRWIDEHLDIPLNLKLLEERLNVSRSTLCRLFRTGAGINPRAYWISRRLERAELLLLRSELSVKEIAYRLGYSSQFHFTNEFSRYRGRSPLHFRKKAMENPVSAPEEQ